MTRTIRSREHQVLTILNMLANASRLYWQHMEDARPVVELLRQDFAPADGLLTSMAAALNGPPIPGTPRHIERLAAALYAACQADSPTREATVGDPDQ